MYQPEAGEKQMAYSTWVIGGEFSKGTFREVRAGFKKSARDNMRSKG